MLKLPRRGSTALAESPGEDAADWQQAGTLGYVMVAAKQKPLERYLVRGREFIAPAKNGTASPASSQSPAGSTQDSLEFGSPPPASKVASAAATPGMMKIRAASWYFAVGPGRHERWTPHTHSPFVTTSTDFAQI